MLQASKSPWPANRRTRRNSFTSWWNGFAPGQVHAVRDLLQVMLDPSRAPSPTRLWDDEPLTAEDGTLLRRPASGSSGTSRFPHEQVLAELGITLEEIENYREPA